jgi:hypothetical protein
MVNGIMGQGCHRSTVHHVTIPPLPIPTPTTPAHHVTPLLLYARPSQPLPTANPPFVANPLSVTLPDSQCTLWSPCTYWPSPTSGFFRRGVDSLPLYHDTMHSSTLCNEREPSQDAAYISIFPPHAYHITTVPLTQYLACPRRLRCGDSVFWPAKTPGKLIFLKHRPH